MFVFVILGSLFLSIVQVLAAAKSIKEHTITVFKIS